MMPCIRAVLSPEQQEPFARTTANACILAGAGSGKTRTLVHLLAADLAAGVPASGIVAFTFTEKAGQELLARIHMLAKKYLAGVSLEGIYIGTIHAWCLHFLLSQSEFYNFTPVDELHVDALVSRLYDALLLKESYGQPYPKAIDNFLMDVEVFYNEHLTLEQVPSKVRCSVAKFLDTLQSNRLMTFGGMVRYATEYLQANGPVPDLQCLYADEYQDVNPAQVALIKAMVPLRAKTVVVGDDLQCIYNWRGSDVTRILRFSTEFKDVSVFRLFTNYRARPPIIDLGNTVADNVELRDQKKVMKPGRDDVDCKVIHWLSFGSEEEQAEAVVDIAERFASEGVPWNRIAVLLRSVVRWGKLFVDKLAANGIAVQCPILSRGGVFINEFLLPVFDWLRRERMEPKNEIEEAEAEEAVKSLWENVRKWIPIPNAEVVFWESINDWLSAIENQRSDAYDVRGWLYDFLDKCGVRVGPDDHNLMGGLGIASQIIRSIEEIHRRRLEGQERRSPRGVMSEVFFALLRKQQDFGESVPIDTSADGVVITTVHQAKGLEWPVVIVPMLVKGRFPVRSRNHNSSFCNEVTGRYGTSLEDESRLFYVATSRAKERLFLLDSVKGKDRARSIFFDWLQKRRVVDVNGISEIDSAVWKLEEVDLKYTDPAPLRIGLSDLLLYVECPYQFGLRRVVAVQPSIGDELGFGKGLHELIRRRLEAEDQWTSEELREQTANHVRLPYMSEYAEAQSRRVIQSRMKKLEGLGVFTAKVESEVPVEVILDGGIVYGSIDSVLANDDGSVIVRDWKSNVHQNFVSRYERQLQFYAYALRIQGRSVSQADMVDVARSAEENRVVAREVDISERTIEELVSTLNESLRGIALGNYPAKPLPISCAVCDMYKICSERVPQ
ncbi:MAG: ATP-dependent helicase [Candidatus Hodarchaeota archaeon]